MSPDYLEAVFKDTMHVLSGESISSSVYEFIAKNGTKRFGEISGSPLIRDGKVVAVVSVARDITDRKKAEEQILLANERLNYLLSATNAVIYAAKTSGDYGATFISENVKQITGYEPHNFIEDSSFWFQHIHPDDQQKVEEEVAKLFEKKFHHYEHRFQKHDGTYIWVHDDMKLVQDENGKPLEIIGFWTDITELKQAEDAIRKSENRLMSIFHAAPVGIGVVSTPDRIIMDANDELSKMLGYYESEFIGKNTRILYSSDNEYKRVKKNLNKQREEYVVAKVETQWKRKDGRVLDILLNSSSIDRRDRSKGITFIAMDITERKQAGKTIRESEAKYRLLVENQTDLVVKVDTKGKFLYVNPSYCKTFGKTEKQLLGKNFMPLVHKDDRESTAEAMKNLNKPPYSCFIEQRALTKDGWRWLAWSDKAVLDKQNKVTGVVGVGRDITERKEFEEKLEKSHSQLRALTARLSETEESERRQLAQELHDQVGQNLSALGINLNTLPSLISPGEAAKIKDRIKDTQKLLDATTQSIRNVMAYLRPSLLDDYGLLAALRWYSLEFSERTGTPFKITGKEFKRRLSAFLETTLYRIAQEALTNVSKHARATKVNIGIRETKGKVALTISDDGKGFTPKTIFKKKKQTVWGLLTMKERAEAIGGKLEIESSPGKGTKIVVEIKR